MPTSREMLDAAERAAEGAFIEGKVRALTPRRDPTPDPRDLDRIHGEVAAQMARTRAEQAHNMPDPAA